MKKKLYLCLALGAGMILSACAPQNSSSAQSAAESVNSMVESVPTYDKESVQIHYQRKDGIYDDWHLWIWTDAKTGIQYDFNGYDSNNGVIASYPLDTFGISGTDNLYFIVKNKASGDWSGSKDPDLDRHADLSQFAADSQNVHHIYLKSGDANVYVTKDYKMLDLIKTTSFVNFQRFYLDTSNAVSSYILYKDGTEIYRESPEAGKKTIVHDFDSTFALDFAASYSVDVTFSESKATLHSEVSLSPLYDKEQFNALYQYDGDDLGAVYSASSTSFKVWSPFSSAVSLRLYDNGTPTSLDAANGSDVYTETTMTKGDKGVFSLTLNGDLAGKYYTYFVKNSSYPAGRETIDPYAKSAGLNGVRGMIVDFSKTNPTGWDSVSPLAIDRKALTVYETHIADLTSSKTWTSDSAARALEKTFAGAALSGTSYSDGTKSVPTGFDHIKALGVNAVQLLPIFDQDNDERTKTFNWGYNPENYNVLEGSYSSDPKDGYARIKEFKALVAAYHDAGINIIMDVVYNHVSSLSNSAFNILAPKYYFRYAINGQPSNGSGCGNETASENAMFRKFMIDSTAFWAKEYKLGGFRFDLMGLHDIDTMNQVVASLKKINPSICVYGEPWTGGASGLSSDYTSAAQANMSDYDGFGSFNDKMRDGLIKGGMSGKAEKGWVTEATAAVPASQDDVVSGVKGFTGTISSDPDKAVIYASCHDNYTLTDRASAAGITDAEQLKYMPMLANALVLTSQGTSFILAGEEFLRTKKGDSNSYASSYAVNELDYALAISNADMVASYKKLIALKQSVDGLHLGKDEAKKVAVDVSADNQISYSIKDTTNNKMYKIVHTNGYGKAAAIDMSGYTLELCTHGSVELSASTICPALSTVIGVKSL